MIRLLAGIGAGFRIAALGLPHPGMPTFRRKLQRFPDFLQSVAIARGVAPKSPRLVFGNFEGKWPSVAITRVAIAKVYNI